MYNDTVPFFGTRISCPGDAKRPPTICPGGRGAFLFHREYLRKQRMWLCIQVKNPAAALVPLRGFTIYVVSTDKDEYYYINTKQRKIVKGCLAELTKVGYWLENEDFK